MAETQEEALLNRALALPCWKGAGGARFLEGGKTNHNVLVEDCGRRYVVRFGADIPEHGSLRWNELALTSAAAASGIGPGLHFHAPGTVVLDYIDARPLSRADIDRPGAIPALAALLHRIHRDTMRKVEGPVLSFWIFHILRDYAGFLRRNGSVHAPLLPGFLEQAERLADLVGGGPTVLGHNDLLPGNILWDGSRFWLIDWEYGGFGNPLFDLGGLASNNAFTPDEERALLEAYDGRPADAARFRQYAAMKCASLLRETLWSMVSEITSAIDFDYPAYTAANLAACRAAWSDLQSL